MIRGVWVLNAAISLYFADAPLASAFVFVAGNGICEVLF